MKWYRKEVKYEIRAKIRMCEYEMLWDTFFEQNHDTHYIILLGCCLYILVCCTDIFLKIYKGNLFIA